MKARPISREYATNIIDRAHQLACGVIHFAFDLRSRTCPNARIAAGAERNQKRIVIHFVPVAFRSTAGSQQVLIVSR
jgi:hypothetical protein